MKALWVLISGALLIGGISVLGGCGSATNIAARLTPDAQVESFDNLVRVARSAYDSGDFESSRAFALEALNIDPLSEEASIIFGYACLGLSGLDTFTLAGKLSEMQKKKTDAAAPADGAASAADAPAAGSSDTSDVLGQLSTVLGLTAEDFQKMSTLDVTDPELPVLIPKCAEASRDIVATLQYVNEAISAACPFVDIKVRLRDDLRHYCDTYTGKKAHVSQAHFLWAFAHLTEALAFNAVLTYGSKAGSGGKTNLELRVAKVQQNKVTDPSQLEGFVASVKSLESTVSAILPVGTTCSETAPTTQLRAVLNDMIAVDLGFAYLPGIPKSITKAITDAMTKIRQIQATANAGDQSAAQSQALKSQLTKKMATALKTKLDDLKAAADAATAAGETPTEVTPEQKIAVCSSYKSIAGTGAADAIPDLCK